MADRVVEQKLTQSEFDRLSAPLERDLTSFFKVLQDAVMELTFDDTREPEVIIDDIATLLDEV